MAQALYRKYRPTSFAEVVNQVHIKTTLQNEIASKQFAQAYLFAGPRGVGKTTMARLLAKAVNAESITKHNLTDSTLLDIIEIDAASHTGVDNVRDNIIQNAYVAPTQLDYKVFIIDEVHMLSVSAFNALLKILEEPPQHIIFILATTEVHKIPATVISRCQRFDFHAISMADIVKRLDWLCQQEKVTVAPVVLERIARKAAGAIRDAETMLGQVLSIGDTTVNADQADLILPRVDISIALELFRELVQRDAKLYLATLQKAVHDGVQLKELHSLLLDILRRSLLYSVDQSLDHLAELDIHADTHTQLIDVMKQLTSRDCLQLIDLFIAAGEKLAVTTIPQLPLEAAGITWCTHSYEAPQATTTTSTPKVSTGIKLPPGFVPPASRSTAPSPTTTTVQTTSNQAPVTLEVDQAAFDQVKQVWPEIMRRVKEVNHSLAMALSVAHLVAVHKPQRLQLGFRYDFHKNRVCQRQHVTALQTALQEVTGQTYTIDCVVGEQYEIDMSVLSSLPSDNIAEVNPAEVQNIWDLALNTIGGKEVK